MPMPSRVRRKKALGVARLRAERMNCSIRGGYWAIGAFLWLLFLLLFLIGLFLMVSSAEVLAGRWCHVRGSFKKKKLDCAEIFFFFLFFSPTEKITKSTTLGIMIYTRLG